MPEQTILQGDCRDVLKTLPAQSVNCIITSPPYWNLRDYGYPEQIGLEKTPQEYVRTLVDGVFAECWRVLRNDGSLWVNLGDTYAQDLKWGGSSSGKHEVKKGALPGVRERKVSGVRSKSLIGIPWRVAIAMIDAGWILRNEVVWHKANPMPESVTDRFTRDHEQFFFFVKEERGYYFDQDRVREEQVTDPKKIVSMEEYNAIKEKSGIWGVDRAKESMTGGKTPRLSHPLGRNKRDVWRVSSQAYAGAHFATFPEALITTCVLASCPEGGTILDPFAGSGTTGQVAVRYNRNAILIEGSTDYIGQIEKRTDRVQQQMEICS